MIKATFRHDHVTAKNNFWHAEALGVSVVSKDCTHDLCRALVENGVPDQPITFHKPNGMG